MTALANHIKAVQTVRRQISALADDDTWRDYLQKHTGKRSLRAMDGRELGRVIDALHQDGAPKAKGRSYGCSQARYARALWIDLADIGAVQDRSDKALDSFVKRMTGVDSARWLNDPAEANKVIEALKSWFKRAKAAALEAAEGEASF